jgi:hypothetical protein
MVKGYLWRAVVAILLSIYMYYCAVLHGIDFINLILNHAIDTKYGSFWSVTKVLIFIAFCWYFLFANFTQPPLMGALYRVAFYTYASSYAACWIMIKTQSSFGVIMGIIVIILGRLLLTLKMTSADLSVKHNNY